ncbi:male-enhanced antigen 1 [Thrips palmi]|uniref:Male-enhanced antigen 1 n=1 Tax=Thrips palmi TaxID=161013 RepID=A0A6P8ZP89_THRPL|nr:male-enhanced antigen 1 [Thrips palmi]XP_034243682.1 male-enhanced antigen 1 [Thrips palmi]XP_034243684.1 male-enhanced antigen 1 [Thrips palmi]
MAPDPPVYPVDENLSDKYNAGIPPQNSDDSDNEGEEQPAYDGYTLLGQHEHQGGNLDNEDDYETENDEINAGMNNDNQQAQDIIAAPPSAGRAELAALWNSAPNEATSNSIAMDDERSAQIRAAMAGFSLPASAVPAWASDIPEELWKERFLGRLQQQKSIPEANKPR